MSQEGSGSTDPEITTAAITTITEETTTEEPVTTQAAETDSETEVNVLVEFALETEIPFTPELTDTTSPEYAAESQKVADLYKPSLEAAAISSGAELVDIIVTFSAQTVARKRRQAENEGNASANVVANYKTVVKSAVADVDETQLNDISSTVEQSVIDTIEEDQATIEENSTGILSNVIPAFLPTDVNKIEIIRPTTEAPGSSAFAMTMQVLFLTLVMGA